MKFRVDFVTNSSSDSTLAVFVRTRQGKCFVDDSADTALFEDGSIEIRNGKLYVEDEPVSTVRQLTDSLGLYIDLDGVRSLKSIAEIGIMYVGQKYGESISNYAYRLERAFPGEFEEDCQNEVTPEVIKKWEKHIARVFGDEILNAHEGDIEGALASEEMSLMFPDCIITMGYAQETIDFSELQGRTAGKAGAKAAASNGTLKSEDAQALFSRIIWMRGVEYYQKRVVRNLAKNGTKYEADVAGSHPYHVNVTVQSGKVAKMSCTCPYAADGLNCKHMAAVLNAVLAVENGR